jgi:hypothetical protein
MNTANQALKIEDYVQIRGISGTTFNNLKEDTTILKKQLINSENEIR